MPEPADVDLIRACKLWDKITNKMNEGEYSIPDELDHNGDGTPYSSGDFSPLQCRIDGKKAELTVGSASGHKAHVDLEKKKLEYYDTDSGPNQVVKELLESLGLKCKGDSDGVKCDEVSKQNVQDVFRVLAMPTSMDYRLEHCREGGMSEDDKMEQCRDQCADTLSSDFNVPEGCNCEDWENSCVDECYADTDWESGEDEGTCHDLEKKFFEDGPKKEELTKAEALVHPPTQKKLEEVMF